jgi:hypothetical protein
MAKKKILTIGFEIYSEDVEYCEFRSDQSLLDWDIILFKPRIDDFTGYAETFHGKACLSDDRSFQLKEQTEHWRREIKTAFDNGKVVIVYLSDLNEVSIATGEERVSGTGRNQKVTRIVTDYDNYRSIPADLLPVKTKGKEIKLTAKNSEAIATYWQEFSSYSTYKVILGGDVSPCLVTKHGDKPVGAIFRSKHSSGSLVLVPDIDFYPPEFFDDEKNWNSEAETFAAMLIKSVVSLDKTLSRSGETTPEPEWAKHEEFKLKDEKKATEKLLQVESKLEAIQAKKEAVVEHIKDLLRLRNLLFEKGRPLEYAILDALKILGFTVSQYDDGESEFDAVFESREGRLIGEAEGKDNKAVNVVKLRQLALNIHEDLEREEVDTPAKGVLFGNAFRLHPLADRSDPFTTKCISAAGTSSTSLVFTPDLFKVTKYLSDNRDSRFATKCRKAILNSIGRVEFPSIPKRIKELSEPDK